MSTTTPGLTWFNSAGVGEARTALLDVCASRAWVRRLLERRPYADAAALVAAADAAMAELSPEDLAEAIAGHPPIGRPEPGNPATAREQAGMTGASPELRARMLELNLEYQKRFGHVFLICATGLTGEQLLAALAERLGNTPERERENARDALVGINGIRLARLAHQGARQA